jgi:hypothetical protein
MQTTDLQLMPFVKKAVITLSELFTKVTQVLRALIFFADSAYIQGRKVS